MDNNKVITTDVFQLFCTKMTDHYLEGLGTLQKARGERLLNEFVIDKNLLEADIDALITSTIGELYNFG